MQQQQQTNQQELRQIFQLFSQEGGEDINIAQINQLIKELETINMDSQTINVPFQPGRRLAKKVNSNDNLEDAQKDSSPKSPTYVSVTELKYFPNNKTTMQFQDFSELFNECMSNKDQHDELLESAFAIFDYDKSGHIDSKKIRKVFQKFKDNTSEEEIQNVLKFCGVLHDQMSLQEFKEFFKKNL
ncbi:unnamed protein product [Paramecium sonneborni]|uniref:EF-hand domain-containing protein n=1 Tax=Paramecium sonneborni TaxID=65129 RepID=A0A8S1LMN1_9CILI|nr:unnamed protein product [Paramecium sonneborni]